MWFPGYKSLGVNEAITCDKLLNEKGKLQIIMIIKAYSIQGDVATFAKRKWVGEQVMWTEAAWGQALFLAKGDLKMSQMALIAGTAVPSSCSSLSIHLLSPHPR